jgi:hypothetical protein
MSSPAVATWTALIKALEKLVKAPPEINGTSTSASVALRRAVITRLNEGAKQPPLPRAAWKKLVQEHKVSSSKWASKNPKDTFAVAHYHQQ